MYTDENNETHRQSMAISTGSISGKWLDVLTQFSSPGVSRTDWCHTIAVPGGRRPRDPYACPTGEPAMDITKDYRHYGINVTGYHKRAISTLTAPSMLMAFIDIDKTDAAGRTRSCSVRDHTFIAGSRGYYRHASGSGANARPRGRPCRLSSAEITFPSTKTPPTANSGFSK